MYRRMIFTVLLASAGSAQAGEKPLYAPAPAWVKPAPPIDVAKIKDDSPILLILDSQQRMQDGGVTSYTETAARVGSTQVLDSLGTVTLPWQPDKGDLTVHIAEIIRGNERIDLLKGGERFAVLRREEQLEQRMLNGLLTATMTVEGLRVGDVLHLSYSTTNTDAALAGNVQAFAALPADPFRVAFGRTRLLWPVGTEIRWKASAGGATPTITDMGGYRELTMALPLPKQPEMPGDAPPRYSHTALIEATSFADWAAISKVMAPLYETRGLIAPGSPLAAEVAKIATATADPLKRSALALDLVQGKVRYMFKGMDGGNYVPQTPSQTWNVRYGDCKAKTLLLLAMLHELGVEAEPVLANGEMGDWLPERLPTPGAFNHVLVRATIAGESVWLDGTANGTMLADIHDIVPFRNVLPLRTAGSGLMPVPPRASARPDVAAELTRDESAGAGLPAPFNLRITLRGAPAVALRAAQSQASKDQMMKMAEKLSEPYIGSSTLVTRGLSFDDAAGTATVTITGVTYPEWNRENERQRTAIDIGVGTLKFDPDRARPAWRDIPVHMGVPQNYTFRIKSRLPDGGKGFSLEGNPALSDRLAGMAVERISGIADGWVTSTVSLRSDGSEIPAAEIPATRQKLAQAQQSPLRIVAPVDYPPFWQLVQAGKAAKRFDAILAAYKTGIADQPEEASSFTNRAWFNERIYEWKAAIDDLTRAIALDPSADKYAWRARLLAKTGNIDAALADALAARKVDPSADDVIGQLADLYADHGDKDQAIGLLDERIAQGGQSKAAFLSNKADILSKAGDKDGAIATIDAALAIKPGDPNLLNSRCWLKGTMNVSLDSALKDCTKAIALADNSSRVLDSRAMVYFRMNQFDDALDDLNAALDQAPEMPASLFMRGIIGKRQGKAGAEADLAAARMMSPRIDRTYAKFGIAP